MSCIAEGYPRLALYTPVDKSRIPFWRSGNNKNSISIPINQSYWRTRAYTLTENELIVLVAPAVHERYDYNRRATERFNCFNVVPVAAIQQGWLPNTAIYRWYKKYSILPLMLAEELIMLDQAWIETQKAFEIQK